MNVRIHITLLDNAPEAHERSLMFMECNHTLPDDTDLAEYAAKLRAVAVVQDPVNAGYDTEILLESHD